MAPDPPPPPAPLEVRALAFSDHGVISYKGVYENHEDNGNGNVGH